MTPPLQNAVGTASSVPSKPHYGQFEYLGRRSLAVNGIMFRGRLLRDRASGLLRFVVTRLSNGSIPAGWPHKEEWVVVTESELSDPT